MQKSCIFLFNKDEKHENKGNINLYKINENEDALYVYQYHDARNNYIEFSQEIIQWQHSGIAQLANVCQLYLELDENSRDNKIKALNISNMGAYPVYARIFAHYFKAISLIENGTTELKDKDKARLHINESLKLHQQYHAGKGQVLFFI